MKQILIDGTPISRQMDGLTQYILNVVLHLDTNIAQYTLLLRPTQCPPNYWALLRASKITLHEANIAPIGPIRDIQFANYLRKHPYFEAAFIPSNQYPISLRIPTVYVIHDLIYEHHPEQLGRWRYLKRFYLHHIVKRGLASAKRIITVSNHTKTEVMRWYGSHLEDKIDVIYEGWEHLLHHRISQQPTTTPPFTHYLLYIGSSRGHKNLPRLIDAINSISLPKDWGLVLVGDMSYLPNSTTTVMQSHPQIHCTSYISDEQKVWYYQQASAVIIPSLSEGFGLPILEALFYNKPLLVSNQAALPEVAGETAIYFNPFDNHEIAKTIQQYIQSHQKINTQQYQDRLALFSWQTTANKISHLLTSI